MKAKISDQEDRQARRTERSSRSSTRTTNGSKREPPSAVRFGFHVRLTEAFTSAPEND